MGNLLASQPLEVVAMGLLEPSSDRRENVLILTDMFSKFTVAMPTREQQATKVPSEGVDSTLWSAGPAALR